MIGADVDKPLGHVFQMARGRNLGHQHRIGLGLRDHVEVLEPPGRIQRIDAHDHFAPAEAARNDGLPDLRARGCLRVRRNGVFEVENDRIGRKRARLLDGARIGSGHVKDAAARTDGHEL